MRPRTLAGSIALVIFTLIYLWRPDGAAPPRPGTNPLPELPLFSPAAATPLYMARSGRTCDNCHTDPTGWKDPELALRKCNLSCQGCHVNPTGGGLRTGPGRFYAQATLPMLFASHRPDKDKNRHLMGFLNWPKNRKTRLWDPAFGKPLGGKHALGMDESRYAGLRADPLLLFGADLRMAVWSGLVFPMQADFHVAVHPLKHLTAMVTAGVLGKSQGFSSTFELGCRPEDPNAACFGRARSTFFTVKDVFLMASELPYASYVRVGRFLPPFGLMHEDHTLSTRRDFELDSGLLHSRVSGVEIGTAPNYPYFQAAFFRPNRQDRFVGSGDALATPDELPPFLGVDGWGAAFSLGWRDLGFQLGVSGMLRRRQLSDGGNTDSFGITWGFNPWFYSDKVPLTYLGEAVFGWRQRQGSGKTTGQMAMMHELDWSAFNGIIVRLRHDYSDFDTQVMDDHYNRLAFGLDLYPLPNLALSTMGRVRFDAGPGASGAADIIVQLHAWY